MFKYFDGKLSQGFVALYSGRMIQLAATGIIGLFLPIFFFIKFGKISYVILYFLAGYLAYALILPWGAKVLNKIGLRRSLRVSLVFDALFYVTLFFIDKNFYTVIFFSFIFLTLSRLTFWLPYHVDFAKFTNYRNRGREIGLLGATKAILDVLMPILAGTLIGVFGYNSVFLIAIILLLSSYIPFAALPRTKEKYSWSYQTTWKRFISLKNRKMVLANMANGAENTVGIVIWPIFIWQLLGGNYFAVGSISSLIVLATILLQLFSGKYTDEINKRKLIHWGSIFYAIGWLVKIFVFTSFQIFLAGTYHSFAQIFKDNSFDTLNYEIMADHGHYVDEYTVLKEMAVQLGRSLMLAFALVLILFVGLNWVFLLAALASLFVNLL